VEKKKEQRLDRRESFEEILKNRSEISKLEYVKDFLSSVSSIVCILNENNQIVFSNTAMLEKFGLDLEENILGGRPGEILNCIHAKNDTGGCGTCEKCQYCGAFQAFEKAWNKTIKVTQECRIVTLQDGHYNQLDLEVSATPVEFEKTYLVVSIQDVTEIKRKAILERIFFHDIINIAGGLNGILEVIAKNGLDKSEEYFEIAQSLSSMIIDEIRAQQQLIKAENGELKVNLQAIPVNSFLQKVVAQIRFHQVAQEKDILVEDGTGEALVNSDEVLLSRVLINMAKNAFEATDLGKSISLKAVKTGNDIRFSIHNQQYILPEFQEQIFKRFFSTKGKDRGFGTYSMKLLGERYLNGKVDFSSTVSDGTTFFIELPFQ